MSDVSQAVTWIFSGIGCLFISWVGRKIFKKEKKKCQSIEITQNGQSNNYISAKVKTLSVHTEINNSNSLNK